MKQPQLGKKIAEIRKAKGLTQTELVSQCNVSVRTIQRIESGVVMPRSYTIKSIMTALDCNFQYSIKRKSRKRFVRFFRKTFEQLCKIFIELFNLKVSPMKKLTILSASFSVLGLSLFLLCTESKAQVTIESNYTQSTERGIIYLFPRGLSIYISNIKDTADYKFGDDLIQEYKNSIFLNSKFIGEAYEGDTIILDYGAVDIKKSYSTYISSIGHRIAYHIPNGLMITSAAVRNNNEYLYLSNQLRISERKNKIYLNNSFIGRAYQGDIVRLRNGTVSIIKNINN